MAANFSDTTPAAPSGGVNVKWQVDGSNNLSAYVPLPTRATMWMDEATVTAGGGSMLQSLDAGTVYNAVWAINTGANGDAFTTSFVVAAGTYTLYILGDVYTNRGIVSWYIDGTLIASGQDWYGSYAPNTLKTVTGLALTAGYHVLKCVVTGKNGSSSQYYIGLMKMWVKQASD